MLKKNPGKPGHRNEREKNFQPGYPGHRNERG